MKPGTQSSVGMLKIDQARNGSGFFSSEAVLDILKLILAGSELSEVLTIIARLVESQGNGTLCTIWLPDADGKHLYCAAAPSLPGFAAAVGAHVYWPERRVLRHSRLSEGAGLCCRHSPGAELGRLS